MIAQPPNMLDPSPWNVSPVSQLVGVPVFRVPNMRRDFAASGLYITDSPVHPQPYIMLRGPLARTLEGVMAGKRNRSFRVPQAFRILANEWAHHLGLDATDTSGFDGGIRHRPTIIRLTERLLDRAGVRDRRYRTWVLRQVRQQQNGRITAPPVFEMDFRVNAVR